MTNNSENFVKLEIEFEVKSVAENGMSFDRELLSGDAHTHKHKHNDDESPLVSPSAFKRHKMP